MKNSSYLVLLGARSGDHLLDLIGGRVLEVVAVADTQVGDRQVTRLVDLARIGATGVEDQAPDRAASDEHERERPAPGQAAPEGRRRRG